MGTPPARALVAAYHYASSAHRVPPGIHRFGPRSRSFRILPSANRPTLPMNRALGARPMATPLFLKDSCSPAAISASARGNGREFHLTVRRSRGTLFSTGTSATSVRMWMSRFGCDDGCPGFASRKRSRGSCVYRGRREGACMNIGEPIRELEVEPLLYPAALPAAPAEPTPALAPEPSPPRFRSDAIVGRRSIAGVPMLAHELGRRPAGVAVGV
jgi:hypothetical protein